MKKRFTQIAGIASITLLSAVVATSPATALTPSLAETIATIPADGVYPQEYLDFRLAGRSLVLSAEARRALSPKADDLRGYEKSLYRGKYYISSQESFRRCVMDRESNHTYTAANGSSSARGAYQFLDNAWRDGLVYMMIHETKKTKDGLGSQIRDLRKKPIHKWDRYFQDRAFFTAMNIRGPWSGKHHWNATVPGTSC